MIVFSYDKTFEGLLTAVFHAYARRVFPDRLLQTGEPLPLFTDETFAVYTDGEKAGRVWQGLKRKLPEQPLSCLPAVWLSELPAVDELLFRYIRKAFDAPGCIALNFGDPDVLAMAKISKKVSNERLRAIQFSRFQKTSDGLFFAAFEPLYNVLPLTLSYFRDRFADQCWLVYDLRREYGYYYDLSDVSEVRFEQKEAHLQSGLLPADRMAPDEKLFQQLWKTYFHSAAVRERINPKLHRQHLPPRFWKYLPEKYA